MKRRNQMIALIVASIVSTVTYSANINIIKAYAEENVTLIESTEADYSNISSSDRKLSTRSISKIDVIKQKILEEINNYNEDLSFDSSYGIVKGSETDIEKVYFELTYEHPEIFWISSTISVSSNAFGTTNLYLRNLYDKDTIISKRAELNNKVKEITDKYKSYSDLRKVYEINDYLLENATYNYDCLDVEIPSSTINSGTNRQGYLDDTRRIAKEYASTSENYTAYGALMNGLCVCEGYSKAFSLLANEYGIENGIVLSEEISHGWNYVNIDGNYYQLDLTWNDTNDEKNIYPYKYFNVSNSQMKIVHDWTSDNVPNCTDTTYDDIFRRKLASTLVAENNVVRIKDKLYGLEYVDTNSYNLFVSGLDGSNKEIIKESINALCLLKKDNNLYYTIVNNSSVPTSINIEKYDTNTNGTSVFLELKKEFDFSSGRWSSGSYIKGNNIIVRFTQGTNPAVTKEFSLNSGTTITALDKATESVIKAEGSKLQADHDSAKALAEALPSGNDKDTLLQRLKAVQAEIDNENDKKEKLQKATTSVVKAENSKLQSDVDSAKTLVDALVEGREKTDLLSRLQVVQDKINSDSAKQEAMEKAITSVVKAESSKLQVDVDSAKTLVNSLVEGTEKINLLSRLQVVQDEIDNDSDKEEERTTLEAATEAVIKAEGSKSQLDVDSAKTLVDALVEGREKTDLLSRLQSIQDEIDSDSDEEEKLQKATEAVTKAESSKLQVDVDSAKTLVDSLVEDTEKTDLLSRLQVVQDEIDNDSDKEESIQKTLNAVIKAEDSKLQSDVDKAKALVDTLVEGREKTNLLSRLQIVQDKIDNESDKEEKLQKATEAVTKAESSKLQSDVDSAKALVDTLVEGTEKTDLLSRLQAVQDEIDSHSDEEESIQKTLDAVIKAEDSKLQADVDSAKTLVDALVEGREKTDLLSRLQSVQDEIDNDSDKEEERTTLEAATEAVIKAEGSKLQADLDSAQVLVKALSNGNDKDTLLQRLKAVQEEIDDNTVNLAIKLVEEAESIRNQTNVNNALEKVNSLKDTAEKTELLERLQVIQNELKNTADEETKKEELKKIEELKKDAIKKAKIAVEKAKSTKTQVDYETALKLVNSLDDSLDKISLLSSLDSVKNAIEYNSGQDNNNNNQDSTDNEDNDDDDDDEDVDIEETDEYEKAEHMLKVFKRNLDEAYYEYVKDAIDEVEDSDEKDDLLDELKKYKKKMKEEYKNVATDETEPTYYEPSNIQTGWVQDVIGRWSFVNPQGWKSKGIKAIGNQTYCFDENGFMKTGWHYDSFLGEWYLFNPNTDGNMGALVMGWINVEGKWYYLNPNKYGAMERNTTINGYKLDGYGVMV